MLASWRQALGFSAWAWLCGQRLWRRSRNEDRIWPVWATELTATFHPTVVKFIFRFELLAKKKITHLWQLPWHLPSALKPISASHLYFSFPLPSGSSHLMRLVMRGKLWRVRLSSWETAQTVVAYELFSLESCHLGNWSASCLLLQARPQNVFQDLSTVLFGPPKYSLSLRSFQYPCGTTSNHLKSLPVHSCNYLAASRRANFSISSQLLKF